MFEILIFVNEKEGWRAMRPTGGQPYQFETKEKALATGNMCYPDGFGETVKVKEV